MKYSLKLLSFMMAVCLGLTLCGCNSDITEQANAPSYEKGTLCNNESEITYSSDALVLSISGDDCSITVTEKNSGRIWRSNPASDYVDNCATGVTKTDIFSQITVSYIGNSNALVKTNSYAASVKKGTYDIYKIKNGFRVEYEFDKGFMIPVTYTLNEGKFSASVLYTGITEKENKISTIGLLPYFGTANAADEGFLLIPDGCGVVIDFNNGKTECAEYSKKIYGVDESLPNDIVTTRQEQIYVPVTGMKKNGGAFVAIAAEGAAESFLNASVSGISSDFNQTYFKAVYRAAENLSVMNGSLGTAGLVLYSAGNPSDSDCFTVEYSFIEADNITVGTMARTIRQELALQDMLISREDESGLYVDFYGGVLKTKSFAGIRYTGVETLTDFTSAKKLIKRLSEYDYGKLNVGYKNYSKSFFGGKVLTDLTPDSAVGGKNGLKALIKYAQENDIGLYFHSDFYSLYSTGNGFSKYFDITKELDLGAARVYPKKLNTNIPDTSADPYYILKPSCFVSAADRILKSADKFNINGIYLGDISSKISADYELGRYKRSGAVKQAEKSAEKLSGKSIMATSPNVYMWKYTDRAVDIPVYSSENHLFDYDVPLLQMLLKGSIPYAGYELNLNNIGNDTVLRHYAFGESLHYGFMAEDPSKLQSTDLLSLYGLSDAMLSYAGENAEKFNSFYKNIKNQSISDYYVYGNVSETVYSNGVRVLVNYGRTAADIDGVTVNGRDFTVVLSDGSVLTGGIGK